MVAEVIINSIAKELNRSFDYIIPESLRAEIKIGSRVFVPFGKTKIEEGFVIGIKKTSDLEVKQINIRVKNIENSKKETVKRLEPPKDIVVDSENIKNEKKSNDVQNKIETK